MKKIIKKNKGLSVFLVAIVLLAGIYFGGNYYYVQSIKDYIYENLQEQEDFSKENLTFKDISGNFLTHSVNFEGMKYEYPIVDNYKLVMTIDEITLNNLKKKGDIITNIDLKMNGLAINSANNTEQTPFEVAFFEGFLQYLKPYKYNLAIEQSYSVEKEEFVLKNNQFVFYPKSNKAAYTNLSFGFKLFNVRPEALSSKPKPQNVRNVGLNYVKVKVYDKGENIQRLLSKFKDYGQFKKGLLTQLTMVQKQINLPKLQKTKNAVFSKLDTFIRNNFENLSLSINFQNKVTAQDIINANISDEDVKIGDY